MRRLPLLLVIVTVLLAVALPGHAGAAVTGGASGPSAAPGVAGPASGGARYGEVARRERRPAPRRGRRGGPVLTSFVLERRRLFLFGHAARVRFRIRGGGRTVRVRLRVVPAGGGKAVASLDLGRRRTGRTQRFRLTGREGGVLPQGRYVLRIAARDPRGRRLRRAPRASGSATFRFLHHRFPLSGVFSYGGAGSRFGAPRSGHRHQGQDLAAVEGTPILAPRGGIVETVAYQARGAGHYVVVDGDGENRDYVFMHMRSGSVRVRRGQRVRTGQRLGDVGNTGRSFGAHLHFEVWVGGWFAGGRPVDPLPLLRAWDRWS